MTVVRVIALPPLFGWITIETFRKVSRQPRSAVAEKAVLASVYNAPVRAVAVGVIIHPEGNVKSGVPPVVLGQTGLMVAFEGLAS